MSNWTAVDQMIREERGAHDRVRTKFLKEIHRFTGRNVIAYYSGWLQKPGQNLRFGIIDDDMNAFMANAYKLDSSLGLDLILHTPGGELAAAEHLIEFLRSKFSNIRVIVPHLAMSAGTLVCMASQSIVMGRHSAIGPFDPQINGMSAQVLIEEYEFATQEAARGIGYQTVWVAILQKLNPSILKSCQHAVTFTNSLVEKWLLDPQRGMFANLGPSQQKKAMEDLFKKMSGAAESLGHRRHFNREVLVSLQLQVEELEQHQKFQDLVLGYHHAVTQTLRDTTCYKLVENHKGAMFGWAAAPVTA